MIITTCYPYHFRKQ